MNQRSLASAFLVGVAALGSSAANGKSLGWVHPRVMPAEIEFLETDVPALVSCVKLQRGDCGLERNDFASGSQHSPTVYFAANPERVEFTESPDIVHVKFPMIVAGGTIGLAVLVYKRSGNGLTRSTAAFASQQ